MPLEALFISAFFAMTETAHAANADQGELEKFAALAHHWWDENGALAPLHAINPLRLDWIASIAPLAGPRVLAVGCGGGILADAMARRGAEVLGIDLVAKSVKVARLHALEAGTQGVSYRVAAAEELAAEAPGSFDVVTCMEMLEHVPDPASVVQACARLLRPGGWLCMATINRNPKSWLYAIVGAEYVLRLLPRGTHNYARMLRPGELAGFCRAAELAPRHMRGLQYNPFTRRYWLSDDTSVNYMLAAQKPQDAAQA